MPGDNKGEVYEVMWPERTVTRAKKKCRVGHWEVFKWHPGPKPRMNSRKLRFF